MKRQLAVLCILFCLLSCDKGPREVNLGEDYCHFCSMTVVDEQYAAQIVTKKGKIYMYDAIECMLDDIENYSEGEVGHWLVKDYIAPEGWLDATSAVYLISEGIQSPMGANLCALKSEVEAKNIQAEKGGNIHSWKELMSIFSQQ